MLEDYKFLSNIYKDIYSWITCNTPGEIRKLKHFQYYDENVWKIIQKKIIDVELKKHLTIMDQEFIKCRYHNNGFRIMPYTKRKKGQVYITNCFQSCSKTECGLKQVSNMHGDLVFIELIADKDEYSIDIFELLCFMIKYHLIKYENCYLCHPRNLEKYEKEEEVLIRISKDNIKKISVVNYDENTYHELSKEEWYRRKYE